MLWLLFFLLPPVSNGSIVAKNIAHTERHDHGESESNCLRLAVFQTGDFFLFSACVKCKMTAYEINIKTVCAVHGAEIITV